MNYQTTQLNEAQTSFAPHHDDVLTTLDNFAESIRNGNIETIMSYFADAIVAYDIMPPIEFTNKKTYQDALQNYFTSVFIFPVNFTFLERTLEICGDLAFANAIIHLEGDTIHGGYINNWFRNSTCLKNINGKWLIKSYHNSVPVDAITSKGILNLAPEFMNESELL